MIAFIVVTNYWKTVKDEIVCKDNLLSRWFDKKMAVCPMAILLHTATSGIYYAAQHDAVM